MKKAFVLVLTVFFLISPKVYAAWDEVSLSMHIDDELKPEKAFNIYLSVISEYDIGCCRIGFSYNEKDLELKNVFLENKNKGDTLYYSDCKGQTDIIYMPENMQDIILRFAPKDQAETYDLKAFLYEVCDRDGNYLISDTVFEFSLDTAVNTESSQNSVPEKIRIRNEVSKERVQSSEITVSVQSENEYSKEYHVIYEEKNDGQTTFLIFAGAAAVFFTGLAVVYKIGFKDGKYTEKKEK